MSTCHGALSAFVLFVFLTLVFATGCDGNAEMDWTDAKASIRPEVVLSDAFESAVPQSVANGAWEDGVHISRDGLRLFAFYAPVDLLSWAIAGSDAGNYERFLRGPTLGMELHDVLHADIAMAIRESVDDPFLEWRLSGIADDLFTQGGPQYVAAAGSRADVFVYTDNNDTNHLAQIMFVRDVDLDDLEFGMPLAGPINNPEFIQDNPHVERLSETDVLLIYDTNESGAAGQELILKYSLSSDNGETWSTPVDITSINTHSSQQGPHLHQDPDSGEWYLYYAATDPDTLTVAIFRSRQGVSGDWDSFVEEEMVVRAGDRVHAVGEPSLTAEGDLSFMTILIHPSGSRTNKYDADPFVARRRRI